MLSSCPDRGCHLGRSVELNHSLSHRCPQALGAAQQFRNKGTPPKEVLSQRSGLRGVGSGFVNSLVLCFGEFLTAGL